jgi:hypothetical protein
MAQLAAVHGENSSFLHWQRSLVHPEFPAGHSQGCLLNYTTRDEGIEGQLLLTGKGR